MAQYRPANEIEAQAPVLDLEAALARLGDDEELYKEMAGYVLEDAPGLVTELQQAVDSRDATTIRMKAHALKGLVAASGGVRAVSAAQLLETAGETGELSKTPALLSKLESELHRVLQALASYCK
jgi:HPt (histidine-containing phosphotransfer) domain-containing protein